MNDAITIKMADGSEQPATQLELYRGEDGKLKLNFRMQGGGWTEVNLAEVRVKFPVG